MHLSRKYIRKVFTEMGIQLSEEALDKLSEKLKIEVGNYALNAQDLGIKRITKDKVPIITGDFDEFN
tara:strand:+ start:1003 stop:1203 length:201 start_codon:yes stop_codon:yes gene_type:complete